MTLFGIPGEVIAAAATYLVSLVLHRTGIKLPGFLTGLTSAPAGILGALEQKLTGLLGDRVNALKDELVKQAEKAVEDKLAKVLGVEAPTLEKLIQDAFAAFAQKKDPAKDPAK